MNLQTLLLWPLAALYHLLTGLRNRLFDAGWLKSRQPSGVFCLSIGNLAVGGTGKTPLTAWLLARLRPRYRVATLSRGYGRRTTGFRLADATDTAATLGDEPLQLFRRYGGPVAVCEDRPAGIDRLLELSPPPQLVLLDDAYQHRRLRPHLQLLLTDFSRLFTEDFLLPAGRLRESRAGAARADAVVVTKCPGGLTDRQKESIMQRIRVYAGKDVPVFFAGIRYGSPQPLQAQMPEKTFDSHTPVVLVSGLARPEPFEAYARQHYRVMEHFAFSDHHAYTAADCRRVQAAASQAGAVLLMTEKDGVKWQPPGPAYVLPIETDFGPQTPDFEEFIEKNIRDFCRA